MTSLASMAQTIEREMRAPSQARSPRPYCPTRSGFWAGEHLGDLLRAAGVKPENLPRERRGRGRR